MHLTARSSLFYQILSCFAPNTLAHIFFGHTYQDQFEVFYLNDTGDSDTAPQSYKNTVEQALIAPSIMPCLRPNPSVREMWVDTVTYEVMDYDQYYHSYE